MGGGRSRRSGLSVARARAELAGRLRGRWEEIEQAAGARLRGIAKASGPLDPEYAAGLHAATSAALEHLLAGVERGEGRSQKPPQAVLNQARLAARYGVSLDTVVRRCFAGYTLFGDFLIEEAESGGLLQSAATKRLLRSQAMLFDDLVAAVTEEYSREAEAEALRDSPEERRADLVKRLLAGEPLDVPELEYELGGHHIGAVVKGPGAGEAMEGLAAALDRRLLAVAGEEEAVWAWLGGGDPIDPSVLQNAAVKALPARTSLAFGESGQGPEGWRLTHGQARAALPIALRGEEPIVRYSEVALLASVVRDDLLAASLQRLYLAPLEAERDGGESARDTLRAYFRAGRNASSAAVSIGVDRSTVASRLRAIEVRLGRPLSACAAEMEAALTWAEWKSLSERRTEPRGPGI
jgi:PucR C-terminal helix-turn-helix domain/GGDEF-like domain